ncbi:MAG: hypothetical protein IJS17_01255 [Clostridia bacterium]|nr:hypothetical protein [Clostridia bacterium]
METVINIPEVLIWAAFQVIVFGGGFRLFFYIKERIMTKKKELKERDENG